MDLVNESGLEAAWLVSKIEPPAFSLTVVVKGTFRLCHEGTATPADEQLPATGDEIDNTNPAKPLRYAMDFAPFKPRTDLLLAGKCHAPGGQPVGRLQVSFRVGRFSKSLAVIGDRNWVNHSRASEPVPFTSLPLSWDRAFGGLGFEQNPIGKGLNPIVCDDGSTQHPLPNVQTPSSLVTDRSQRVQPGGFGPIPDTWPQRLKKFGKINGRYLKERWPWYPENIDWGFFNAAPEDQQVEGYLRGDEEIAFEHLHPTIPSFRSRLPGLRARCFLNELVRAHEELREVPLRLDTLWVQPDAEQLVLVWRGHLNVRTEKLLEVYHVLVTTEPLSVPPAPLESFPAVLQDALARRAAEDDELEPEEEPEDELEDTAEAEEAEPPEQLEPAGESLAVGAAIDDESEPEGEAEVEEPEAPDPDDPLTLEQIQDKLSRLDSFEGCDLSGLALAELDFGGLNLREAILEGAVLIRANLAQADLSGAVLAGANLREANCAGAIFAGADLTEAWLSHADLSGADLRAADFSKARLRQANLAGAKAAESIFEEADLSEANLSGADLTASDLCKARIHRTDFTGANMTDAAIEQAWGRQIKARGAIMRKLRGASALICEADFQEIQAEESVWQFAQLYAANFTRARLDAAEFSTAYLGEAIFDVAEMNSACLDEANLRRARLRRTNLFGVSLDKADLSEADFTESNLYGASFMETTLGQTKLQGANLRRIKAKEPIA
jgi:uncharacterized protein YjbI with pentapeptide repeats